MQSIILEFDDLHWHNSVNCIDIIETLVKRFPPIILNFFVPAKYNHLALYENVDWCNRLRHFIESGNVNLAIHGLTHEYKEFEKLQYKDVRFRINEAESILNTAKLPFQKVFRGPYWSINRSTYECLIDLEYTHVYSHTSYHNLNTLFTSQIPVVYYNWNLKDSYGTFENMPKKIIVAHGHTGNVCGNGIAESFDRICNALENNSFEFLTLQDYRE